MMRRTKSLKLSTKLKRQVDKRKNRNRLKKLSILLILLCFILLGICIGLGFVLADVIHKPLFISPVVLSMKDMQNDDKIMSDIEKILQEKNISYSVVSKYRDMLYKIKLNKAGEVIVSSQKDLYIQISSLQYILSRLTMEGKDFSRLDLQFDKPVIVLK